MPETLPTRYDHKESEEKIYNLWEESGGFSPDKLPTSSVKHPTPYSIFLPPPNITGSLHMGHALNAVMSDILIRYHRMKGYKTVWFPGIDHAGIATQNVVEKELKKEGKTRWDLGREKFVERVWQWKEKYGHIILDQLKKLGCSLDWSRFRFTLDDNYAAEVKQAFLHYHKKGLIYRGKRVVNWCPRCQTSLSDLEIVYKEEETSLWYIKYGPLTLATVRPETKFGDTALAVNPKDERYKKYVGKEIEAQGILGPLKFKVIADDAVDEKFGTGVVKVTPAHDIADFEMWQRHKDEIPGPKVIIDEQGRLTGETGKFKGLKVKEAREKVVEELKKLGLLEKVEDYTHNVATCDRCGTVVEPLLSNQWFLKMKELAQKALEPVQSGKIKIIPENFQKPYIEWLEHIRDWCISRQIWWGHQLPVFFCRKKLEENQNSKIKVQNENGNFIVAFEKPKTCPICKNCEMKQSEDVLDTWFSSALWPFAALSEEDIKAFYPSNVLITDRGIINLWVGRMIFSGLEFRGEIPFPHVLIHATVLTKEGVRMSKSKGTGEDPMKLIETYGADATRFGIIWQALGNQDIRWDETACVGGKKFITKLWNIARFILPHADGVPPERSAVKATAKESKGMMQTLEALKKKIEGHIAAYRLGQALHEIYEFVWHDFADVYIEQSKKMLQNDDESVRRETKTILSESLIIILKLLHPFMPFVTEEIHQKFQPEKLLATETIA